MKDCQIVQERLSLFIDEQLSLSEKEMIEAHLASCQLCSREYEQLKRTVDLLRSLEPVEVPSDFRFKLRQRLHASQPQNNSIWKKIVSRPWLSLGAAVAGFLLLFMTMNVLSPDGFSPENFAGDPFPAKSITQDQAALEKEDAELSRAEVLEKSPAQPFDLRIFAGEGEMISPPAAEEESAEIMASPPTSAAKQPGGAGVKAAARNGANGKNDEKTDEEAEEMTAASLPDDEAAGEEIALFRGLSVPEADVILEFQFKDLEKALLVIEGIAEEYDLSSQITVLESETVVELQVPSSEKDMILAALKPLGEPVTEKYYDLNRWEAVRGLEEKREALLQRKEELEILMLKGGSGEELNAWQAELERVEEEIDLIDQERADWEKETALIHISIKLISE